MKCPVCHVDMIVVERKKIELDYCVKCHGVWFDSGEMELLLETLKSEGEISPETSLPELPGTQSSEEKRKCPICGKKMKKVLLGEVPPVLIDACPRHGLWFDAGEVDQLIEQIDQKHRTHHAQAIVSFLGDAFQSKQQGETGKGGT